jgi:hypothetical protein
MSTSEKSHMARTYDEVVGILKRQLKFTDWPLRETEFIAGFSAQAVRSGVLADYRLERKTLLPPIISRVTRRYFYRELDSRLALDVTVIVSQIGARDAAEGLIQLVAASQMHSEPRVDFAVVGNVTVYRRPDTNQSLAFLRNNIGINIESYGRADKGLPVRELAQQIDSQLKEIQTTTTLTESDRLPRILRFEPKTTRLKAGERTDLVIDIQDSNPPQDLLFNAVNGSYNHDPDSDLWYFRAAHEKGSAEVALTVVNDVNLMATARTSITID